MDLDAFARLVADPARSRDDLKAMLENVLKKGAREHAAIAKAELDRRFLSLQPTALSLRSGAAS